jgi:hypothetical protein
MKLTEMRQAFLKVAPDPRGWDDLWAAFVAVSHEPIDEPGVLYDNVLLEIAPAHPPWSEFDGVALSRRIGLRGVDSYNDLEAALVIDATWGSVDVGAKPTEIAGSGPSSYEHDPAPSLDEFVAEVESSPVVAALRGADGAFRGWQAHYQTPQELD